MDAHAQLHQSQRVLSQRAEDTLVLLDPDTGEYYSLDEVGGRVWDLCDGTRSGLEIAAVIESEYDAPSAVIRGDVLELLAELSTARLVAPRG